MFSFHNDRNTFGIGVKDQAACTGILKSIFQIVQPDGRAVGRDQSGICPYSLVVGSSVDRTPGIKYHFIQSGHIGGKLLGSLFRLDNL